jgi:ABC-type nitrate/sulfonate/bicarbonate transport system substrate-binding protein
MRRLIFASLLLLLSGFLLQFSVHAADKIRIGFPAVAANYLSLPLGQKKGFFQEEGLQAELIRMDVGLTALVSGTIDIIMRTLVLG